MEWNQDATRLKNDGAETFQGSKATTCCGGLSDYKINQYKGKLDGVGDDSMPSLTIVN